MHHIIGVYRAMRVIRSTISSTASAFLAPTGLTNIADSIFASLFHFVSLTSSWCGQKPSLMCRTRTETHRFTRHCVTTHCPSCDNSKICKMSASWSPGNPPRTQYVYLLSLSHFKSILLEGSLKHHNKNLLKLPLYPSLFYNNVMLPKLFN